MRRALPLLLAVVVATGVAAADDCLTGGATLADQRGLDAVANATETACPCAEAATGRAWRRCARRTLIDALDTGLLRSECRKAAKQIIATTSCGGDAVPCGAVPLAGSDGEPACRLARPKTCEDTRRAKRTTCAGETSCDAVVTWTAGTCFDPRDAGPYTPGARVVAWTKDSAAQPGTPRTLETVIWYPAATGAGPVDGTYHAVLDAPLDPGGGPYPVVLFSHGSCGYPLQSTFLTPLLASRGFIVVAPPHPGNTLEEFPRCGTAPAQVESFIERPHDMRFVLDGILAAGADPSSPFFGAVDGNRVAMTGHSFGGLTTFLVASQDPRITTAVAMAPATLSSYRFTMPSLIALGHIDSVVDNPAARAAYAASAPPKVLVEVEHGGHYVFSDFCFASSDCNPPTTLTQDEAHAAALRWIVPFLERYLAGRVEWAPLLGPPAGPGYVYQAAL